MNIQNRLKKLELETIHDSAFCACHSQTKFETYTADLSEDSNSSEPVLMGDALPTNCPNCRKPIEKKKIVIKLCDQTTKDRFPDEWKAR